MCIPNQRCSIVHVFIKKFTFSFLTETRRVSSIVHRDGRSVVSAGYAQIDIGIVSGVRVVGRFA